MSYPLREQSQDYWCWAAVASSVRNFFEPSNTLSQCQVATQTLNEYESPGHACCSDPAPCNLPYFLDRALTITGHFNRTHPAPLSWEEVKEQIDLDLPLCAYLEASSSAHYVVISGCTRYQSGLKTLHVCDPDDNWLGEREVLYDNFLLNYMHTGLQWKATFLLKD